MHQILAPRRAELPDSSPFPPPEMHRLVNSDSYER